MDRDALGVEQQIAVRARQPEVLLAQAQQHGIVDDAAVLGGDQHVFALPHAALAQVARRQQAGKTEGVRAGDFGVPLHGHVPQSHLVQQVPVLIDRIVIVAGQEHVVVNGVGAAAVTQRGFEEG
jgi:hypothetical protein